MTITPELIEAYRNERLGALRPLHTRTEESGCELTVYKPNKRIMARELARGLSYEARKALSERQRADRGVPVNSYNAPSAKDALARARAKLERRALGLDKSAFAYIGEVIPTFSDETIYYMATLPLVNGNKLVVLVTPDEYYEGAYERRGLSTKGPRRQRMYSRLTTKEREYRARNDGAASDGYGYRDRWYMYYDAMEDCDLRINARYFHKRGMARHDAWINGAACESYIERQDSGDEEKSYYYMELREVTPDGVDVVTWESVGGIEIGSLSTHNQDMEYLAESAYDMMSSELLALIGQPPVIVPVLPPDAVTA